MHVLDRRSEQYLRRERQVLQWMVAILQPTSPPTDLYQFIKDGVTLCRLVEAIRPNLIPQFHREVGEEEQMVTENIEMFREAIIRYGVPRAMVFECTDLNQLQNMSLVVSTMTTLADVARSREFPIPLPDPQPCTEELTVNQQTALRNMNKSVGSKRKMAVKRAPRIVVMSTTIPSLKDVDITPGVENGMIKLQALVRGFLTRKHIRDKKKKAEAYRFRVVKEILETEEKYVSSLGSCIEHFLDPLVGSEHPEIPEVTRDQVRAIFSDIRIIHQFHKESILDVIRPRIEQWDNTQRLGDVFLRITSMMKIYTQYIANYSHSTQTLAELHRSEEWKAWRQQQEKRVNNMGLSSFLIMPVQRVPRYILLLSDLYKNTPRHHPDAVQLNEARLKMEKVTHFLNSKKMEAEKLEHLARLAEEFHTMGFNLAEPHRKFLREDTIGDHRVILCNDILVMVKPTPRDYRTSSTTRIRNTSVPTLRVKQDLIKGFPLEELLLDQCRTHFLIRRSSDSEILISSADIPESEQNHWKEAFESVHTDAVDANSVATPRQSGQTPRNKKDMNVRWDSIRRIRDQRTLLYSHMDAVDVKLQNCNNKKERAQLVAIQKSFSNESQSLEKELSSKLAKQRVVKQRSGGSSILLRPAASPNSRSCSV